MNVPINTNVHQKPPQFLTKSHHYPWPNAITTLGQKGPHSMTTPVLITKGHHNPWSKATTTQMTNSHHDSWPKATTTIYKIHLNLWPSQPLTKIHHSWWPKATTILDQKPPQVYFYFYFLTGWNSTYYGKKWRYLWRCSKSSLLKGEKWLVWFFDSI